ncbi:MAG: PspC domain-containing protein [Chloroflexi bacterium]|nr:PspC domain-containing protein [Chloroflexota bacterium]
MDSRRLHKSSTDKVLFGVCGGLAEYFNIDPVLVRVVFILLLFANGIGLLLYLILAILTPRAETAARQPTEVAQENLQTMAREVGEAGRQIGAAVRGAAPRGDATGQPTGQQGAERRRNTIALILIVVGVLILLANIGAFWWFRWGTFWPLVLVAIGVGILIGRFRRG